MQWLFIAIGLLGSLAIALAMAGLDWSAELMSIIRGDQDHQSTPGASDDRNADDA